MGSKGSNTTTTAAASSTTPNPAAMDAYYALLNRAGGVASTPYQAYTGNLTAPVNAQQTAGINAINSSAGFAQPFIQQAAGFATNAANPLSAGDIARYQSPYTQSVVDATTNWFNNQNKQQQQNVLGNAAAQGALGGDRVGVAQANLAAQQTASQAPIIQGLYDRSYQQALGVAQQQQQNQANAAYSLGNLGVAGQNAALTGANAQVGAGSLQQQNEQQRLNALYQQYQIGQAFPYQQTQWLAGIDTGVGSQLGGTSTNNGSTTAPAPNPWAQVAGVGLAAAGAFLKRGGGIPGFAPGGTVEDAPFAGVGWIPTRGITMGRGAPPPPGMPQSAARPPDGMADLGKGVGAFAKAARGHDWSAGPLDISSPGNGFTPSGVGATFSPGQFDMAGAGLGGIYRDGGAVRGFAPGGTVDDLAFADRWSPAVGAVADGTFDPQGLNGRADNFDITPTVSDAGVVPLPRARPDRAPQRMIAGVAPAYDDARADALADRADGDVLPAHALGFAADDEPQAGFPDGSDALPFSAVGPNGKPYVTVPDLPRRGPDDGVPMQGEPRRSGFNLGLIPDHLRMPLLTAGLAMLASRSPNLGNAIGEGGLAGVGAYSQQRQQDLAHIEKAQQLAQQNRRLDLDAKRLDNAAEMSRKTLALHTQTAADTKAYREGLLDRENNKLIGTNEDGLPVYLDTRTGKETVGTTKLQGRDNLKPTGALTEDGHPIMYDTRKPGAAIDGITGKPLTGSEKVTPAKPAQTNLKPTGMLTADGHPVMYDAKKPGVAYDSITGVALKPDEKLVPAKPAANAILPDETIADMAGQYLAGDKSVMQNLGRGAQGAENIVKLRSEITRQARAAGMKPDQVATKMADFAGRTAAMRSLGTRGVNVEYAANTANKAIDLAEEAYSKLPRTAFVPFNQLVELYGKKLSSPEQAAAYAATNTLVNEYARVAAGGSNQATEGMRQHAREMLNTAMDHKSFNAVLGMMRREIQTAKSAYQETRQEFLSDHSEGKPGAGPTSAVTPGAAAPVAAAAAAAGAPAPALPSRPASVPEGSAYSPGRQMWRAPSGQMFNAQGQPVQ